MRSLYTIMPLVAIAALGLGKPETESDGTALADSLASRVAIADPAPAPVHTAEDSLLAETQLAPAGVRPTLELYFARFSKDRMMARRVARAVAREARRHNVSPSLVAAVLVTENAKLEPAAQSSVGAQGLMQVMPMHAGTLGCNSDDLVDVDSNICHGTTILARNLRRAKSPRTALLRYNGCVKGTNTPNCHQYPGRVLTRASRVRREVLVNTNAMGSYRRDHADVVVATR